MSFKNFWKSGKRFTKADTRLSIKELMAVRKTIIELQAKNLPSSKIITKLQNMNKKLVDRWKAERAYWTEVKAIDTAKVKEAGEALDLDKYRIILSPSACQVCRKATNNGRKIFKHTELQKDGHDVPPFHPNCYCIVVPV